jgi:hypothetical protein
MSESNFSEEQLLDTQKSREQIAAQIIRISTNLGYRAVSTGLELRDTEVNSKTLPDGLNITTSPSGYTIALVKSGLLTHSFSHVEATGEVRLATNDEIILPDEGMIAETSRIITNSDGVKDAFSAISLLENGSLTHDSINLTDEQIIKGAAHILGPIRAEIANFEIQTKQVDNLVGSMRINGISLLP